MTTACNQAKWDRRYLDLARLIAGWSKDPSTGVGAVLVDPDKRVVSLGFNGLPRAVNDAAGILDDRASKYATLIHAEQNALLFAARPVTGCTCYTWPLPPCSHCAALLIQAGLRRIVSPADGHPAIARWEASTAMGMRLLSEAGVIVDRVTTIVGSGDE